MVAREARFSRVFASSQAEVADPHTTVIADEHIRRFEVAVDELLGVRRLESQSRGVQTAHDLGRAAASCTQPLRERLSLDELHDEKTALRLSVLSERMDGDDVRMRQASHRLSFSHQALRQSRRRRFRAKNLDGDPAPKRGVLGGIDDAHSACPQNSFDDVLTEPLSRLKEP
jgi:hypothetical protein